MISDQPVMVPSVTEWGWTAGPHGRPHQGTVEAGLTDVLTARRAETLEPPAAGIESDGANALVVPQEMTDGDPLVSLVDTVTDVLGRIDVLVNGVAILLNSLYRSVLDP